MSWTKRTLAGMVAGAACLVVAPQVALAGVVVSSSGPSAGQYPVGKQVGAADRITLRDGDTVTVLHNGATRVFRGAGSYSLGQASSATSNRAFASLTGQRSASRARTGAVRTGDAGPVRNPSLWYVDVAAGGTICQVSDDNIRLWRANTQAASTYAIEPEGGGEAISVTFPAGEMLAAWDIYHPPQAGTNYRIGHGSDGNVVTVRFAFLDAVPETAEDMASALIANGCTVQLEQMAAALTTED